MNQIPHPRRFACPACGAESDRWQARCPACQAWTSTGPEARGRSGPPTSQAPAVPARRLTSVPAPGPAERDRPPPGDPGADADPRPRSVPISLTEVDLSEVPRISTGIPPLDLVLGGGLVRGSLVLIGGDPGAGKSTLLAQALAAIRCDTRLYVTGEESVAQAAMRAHRVRAVSERIKIVAETDLRCILEHAVDLRPQVMVVDSIQTTVSQDDSGIPGSSSQLRHCTERFMHFAKSTGIPTILIGHVTKEGEIGGPKVLEHFVDAVLQMSKDEDNELRYLTAHKNRFGATSQVGGFEMTEEGLVPVDVDPEDLPRDGLLPLAQELLYRFLELGGKIDDGLRDRLHGRLDVTPRSGP